MKRFLILGLALSVLGLGSIAGCEKKAETKKQTTTTTEGGTTTQTETKTTEQSGENPPAPK